MGGGEPCSVEGCSSEAIRSLSPKRLSGTSLRLKTGSRKAALCKEHYKQFKKETKEQRKIERDRFRTWSK
jgi:hypothetical protein